MKVEVSKEEAGNIRLALMQLAKSPQVDEQAMKILLMLSEKFTLPEVVKVEKDK